MSERRKTDEGRRNRPRPHASNGRLRGDASAKQPVAGGSARGGLARRSAPAKVRATAGGVESEAAPPGGVNPGGVNKERLQKILSAAGVASRRLSEELIVQGRVSVNGDTVTELGTKADPAVDEIKVDGRRIKTGQRRRYVLLNKPRGYITTRSDPEGRPTVMDLMTAVKEYIYPVGRLDYDSEGLLLLTNDGELAARLTHPRHEVEKVYEARVRGVPDDKALDRLARGVPIDGRRTAPAKIRASEPFARGSGEQTIVEISIHEGRQRQVRKMFEAVGHPVVRLKRVRIGPLEDPEMPVGHWRELTPQEVVKLQRASGLHTKTPRHKNPVGPD